MVAFLTRPWESTWSSTLLWCSCLIKSLVIPGGCWCLSYMRTLFRCCWQQSWGLLFFFTWSCITVCTRGSYACVFVCVCVLLCFVTSPPQLAYKHFCVYVWEREMEVWGTGYQATVKTTSWQAMAHKKTPRLEHARHPLNFRLLCYDAKIYPACVHCFSSSVPVNAHTLTRSLSSSSSAVWLSWLKVPAHVALATHTGILCGSSSGLVPDLNSESPLVLNLSRVLHVLRFSISQSAVSVVSPKVNC